MNLPVRLLNYDFSDSVNRFKIRGNTYSHLSALFNQILLKNFVQL